MAEITSGISTSMSYNLTLAQAKIESITVRAFYGNLDSSYIPSNPFTTDWNEAVRFATQPACAFASISGESIRISWETSFVPVKAEIGCYLTTSNIWYSVAEITDLSLHESYDMPRNLAQASSNYYVRAFYGNADSNYIESDAFSPDPDTMGFCGINGSNQTWSFDKDSGTLTISGTGQMANFTDSTVPWRVWRNEILTVVVADQVSHAVRDSVVSSSDSFTPWVILLVDTSSTST